MSNKITAHFGADVSEVEAKMMQATRATKYYERAVRELDKQAAANRASGLFGRIAGDAPKAIGRVKELAGAFGAAGAAAGLVPGLGVAAIGVAALSAGISFVKRKYDEAADAAKRMAEYTERAVKATVAEISLAPAGADESRLKKAELERQLAAEKSPEQVKRLRAEIAELNLEIAKADRDSKAAAADAAKKQSEAAERAKREADKRTSADIKAIEEKRRREAMSDDERIKELQSEISIRRAATDTTLQDRLKLMQAEEELKQLQAEAAKKRIELEAEVADVVAMIGDQQKKNGEAEIERTKRLAEERQKAAEAGRQRNRERFGEQLSEAGFSIDEEGNIRSRRGRKVSKENAARVLETRRRQAEFTAQTGQVRSSRPSASASGKTAEANFLEKIEAYLRPESTK